MKQPIFIVGAPRSGTTLIGRVLNNHPQIFISGETHFFLDIYLNQNQFGNLELPENREKLKTRLLSIYQRYNEPRDQHRIEQILTNPSYNVQLEKALSNYKETFSTFMEIQAQHESKVRWGNSVPKDIFHYREINNFYPDSKFIVCIRDIRDFLLSYKGKWRITSGSAKERVRQLYHPVISSYLWKASMNVIPKMQADLGSERILIVRYEDFVSNPKNGVENLCSFLGEQYSDLMLDVKGGNSSNLTIKETGIYKNSLSRWKSELSNEEVWIAQKIGKHQLINAGYSMSSTHPNMLKICGYYLSAPFALWRSLVNANSVNMGRIMPYLIRRLKSLI